MLLTGWGAIRPLAAGIVIGFFLINAVGLKAGRTFQNVVTVLKVAVIVAIVVAGFLPGPSQSGVPAGTGLGGWGGFALAYLAVAFTYYGWDDGLKMAGEFKNPGYTLPRVLLGGAIIVAVLYVLINLAFLVALSPEEMAGSPLVAAEVVAKASGEMGRRFVTVAALVILISSCNVQFLGLPRVAFGLAEHGLAPQAFARTDDRGTPMAGLGLVTGFVFLMAMTGSFLVLIQFLSVTALMIDGAILIGLFRLRRTEPHHDRPYTVPWYPWLPGITLAAFVGLFVIILVTQPIIVLGALAILATLMLSALGWQRLTKETSDA